MDGFLNGFETGQAQRIEADHGTWQPCQHFRHAGHGRFSFAGKALATGSEDAAAKRPLIIKC